MNISHDLLPPTPQPPTPLSPPPPPPILKGHTQFPFQKEPATMVLTAYCNWATILNFYPKTEYHTSLHAWTSEFLDISQLSFFINKVKSLTKKDSHHPVIQLL